MAHTLLLADDSVTIQRVIELTFADEDIKVLAVGDGQQAVERIEADPPDIILADVGMPKRNGYEVATYVKSRPKFAHIPVVLLTGAFEPIDQARAIAAGCDGVLAKPFEPQLVISRVKELLSGKRETSGGSLSRPAAPVAEPDGISAGPRRTEAMKPASPSPVKEPAGDLSLDMRPAAKANDSNVLLDDYFDQLDAAFAKIGSTDADLPVAEPRPPSRAPNNDYGWLQPEALRKSDTRSFNPSTSLRASPPTSSGSSGASSRDDSAQSSPSTPFRATPSTSLRAGPSSPLKASPSTPLRASPTTSQSSRTSLTDDSGQDMSFDMVQGGPFDSAQGKPFDSSASLRLGASTPLRPTPATSSGAARGSSAPSDDLDFSGVTGIDDVLPAPRRQEENMLQTFTPAAGMGQSSVPEGLKTTVSSGIAPAPPIAERFAALLAAEQGERPLPAMPPPPAPEPTQAAIPDSVVDQIVSKVLEKLSDNVVRDTVAQIVSRIAERLVREEIERIKQGGEKGRS